MGIQIIADSVSDIPKLLQEQYNIRVVPLTVQFGDEVYRDNIDLTSEEFYKKLSAAEVFPTTSQVTPTAFEEVFSEEIENGNELIVITLSSEGSGTFQAANIAASEFEGKISVFDTLQFSMGEGLLVIEAAKMVQQGKTIEQIIVRLQELRDKVRIWFAVDDLKHLQKGGRITGAAAVIGGILNLKPILTVENGLSKPVDKVRGRKKVFSKFIEKMKEEMDLQFDTVYVGHAAMPEMAEELKELIKQEFNSINVIVTEIGSVVGTHAGPGAIGIFYYKK